MQAKDRLKSGNYKDKKFNKKSMFEDIRKNLKIINCSMLAEYKLVALSKKEDEDLYKKFCEIGTGKDVLTNPIGLLVDKEHFEQLDNVGKERYIFNLSEKYKKFKTRKESEQESAYIC